MRVDFYTKNDENNNVREYEIVIYKMSYKQVFYLENDKELYLKVYNQMKKYCVLANMKHVYEFSKKLDEGGFSKVLMFI